MSPRRFRYRVSATTSERIVASAVVALSIAIAALGIWVFRSGRMRPGTSTANAILADRATLGFVRLLVIVVAVYGLASIAVLVTRGRWLRSISTTGIEAEEASESDQAISELKANLNRAREERDEANRLLWSFLHG